MHTNHVATSTPSTIGWGGNGEGALYFLLLIIQALDAPIEKKDSTKR